MSERRPGLGRSKELALGVGLLGFALVVAVFLGALERERHPPPVRADGSPAPAAGDGSADDPTALGATADAPVRPPDAAPESPAAHTKIREDGGSERR